MSCPSRISRAWRTTVRTFARRSRARRTRIHQAIRVRESSTTRTRCWARSQRVASNFLTVVDGFTTFTPAQIARDKAFAEFLRGMSLGYFALFYDSAAVVTKGQDPLDKGDLRYSKESWTRRLPRCSARSTTRPHADGRWRVLASRHVDSVADRVQRRRSSSRWFAAIGLVSARTSRERRLNAPRRLDRDHCGRAEWLHGRSPTLARRHQRSVRRLAAYLVSIRVAAAGIRCRRSSSAWATFPGTTRRGSGQPLGARGCGQRLVLHGDALTFGSRRERRARHSRRISRSRTAKSTADRSTDRPARRHCKRYFANRTSADPVTGVGWGWSNYDFIRVPLVLLEGRGRHSPQRAI